MIFNVLLINLLLFFNDSLWYIIVEFFYSKDILILYQILNTNLNNREKIKGIHCNKEVCIEILILKNNSPSTENC